MKKLIWKFRYAKQMRRRTKGSWAFCWEAAQIAADDWLKDEWADWIPKDAADEELSYWG